MDDAGNAKERVRVSDAERAAVVARFNTATSEGRLTLEEFGDRAGQAYAARTAGELDRVVDDLPAVTAPPVGRSVASTSRERTSQVIPIGTVKLSGHAAAAAGGGHGGGQRQDLPHLIGLRSAGAGSAAPPTGPAALRLPAHEVAVDRALAGLLRVGRLALVAAVRPALGPVGEDRLLGTVGLPGGVRF